MKTRCIVGVAWLFGCACAVSPEADLDSARPVTSNTASAEAGATEGSPALPLAEDPQSFASRFAAVTEVVGEASAARVMRHADEQAVPLYSLELENGVRVEWYELTTGIPFIAVTGARGSEFPEALERETLSPSELFRALSPEAVVPGEIEALSERQVEMAPIYAKLTAAKDRYSAIHLPKLEASTDDSSLEVSPKLSGSANVGLIQEALTSSECFQFSVGCNGQLSFPNVETRRDRTREDGMRMDDVNEVRGVGCSLRGMMSYRVRHRTWWSWSQFFNHDLPEGFRVGGWVLGAGLDFDFESFLHNFRAGAMGAHCAGSR